MLKVKYILLILLNVLFSCNTKIVKTKKHNTSSKELKKSNQIKTSESFLVFFENETKEIFIKNGRNVKKTSLGYFSNTFGDKPILETIDINKDSVFLVIITNHMQLGITYDEMTLFKISKNDLSFKRLLIIEEIGKHDSELDTISNVKYYDFKVNNQSNEVVINEFNPFKKVNSNSNYSKSCKKYKWSEF